MENSDREARALFDAIEQDDVDMVQALLARGVGADVQEEDFPGETPLLLATAMGNVEISRVLIEAGANVNTPDEFGNSMLIMANVGDSDPEIVELLLKAGAEVNKRDPEIEYTALDFALDDWESEADKVQRKIRSAFLLRQYGGISGVLMEPMSACFFTPDERLLLAIDQGYDLTFLSALGQGADVNVRSAAANHPTALMKAAAFGRYSMLQELLAHGANANARDGKNRSVLWYSLHSNNARLIQTLLEAGAKIGEDAQQLLSCAAKYGYDESVLTLLQAGVPASFRDNPRLNALSIAQRFNTPGTSYPKVIEHLLAFGAGERN